MLVVHVSFLSLFLLRKQLISIFDIDQGQGQVVASADALEPVGLDWKTGGTVEVAH